ncbi:hypothetical protein NDU88_004350 [Pleurodeles waltl]|uniref:Uncharacterized protein n=1 Tax=Pleurodeles waltl TaxID=8319 RepID=A0AAV7SII3_PLEWA|nr:hypothetical protein NDU88_004350 [Pleurodeles waltl]
MDKMTTIAKVVCELEWSPVQEKSVAASNSLETAHILEEETKALTANQDRVSLTDQELGALSEQFLNNIEEQIDRTLSRTTAAKMHSGGNGVNQLLDAPQMHKRLRQSEPCRTLW